MSSTLSVSIDGDALEFINAKLSAIDEPEFVTDILDEAQALLLNRIRKRFLNTEDTGGEQWPVSEAARRRAALGRGGKTLFDKGTLFHSIQAFDTKDENERGIGTDVFYGRYHQDGTDNLPVREFIGASEDNMKLISRLVFLRVKELFQ